MFQKAFGLLASSIIAALLLGGQVSAAASTGISVAAAYPKGNGNYDVIVKDAPGTKLVLYINDKAASKATVNKSDWATFHKVKLTSDSKISFTKQLKSNKKLSEKPINYARYYTVANGKASFSVSKSAVVATPTPAAPAPAPVAPAPASAPTCTNGSYVNTAGNTVCNPETAPSTPVGATAQCVDGSYSFSQSRSGTCSHHGGVAEWL